MEEQPEPQSFKYYGVDVYNLDELMEFDQAYFYGCLKRKRNVLIKKNISRADYYYAKKSKYGWESSHKKYNKAKILVTARWVKSNVTKFLSQSDHYNNGNGYNDLCFPGDQGLTMAPPILELEDHEKFQDSRGNVFEVEVRGVRENGQIYFRATDIETLLEMDNLIKRLKQTQYTMEEDYILFLVDNFPMNTFEAKRIRRTFVTYNGLLKLIFRSRSRYAHCFCKWATRVIFTAHVGTEEQRLEKALEIGRVNSIMEP